MTPIIEKLNNIKTGNHTDNVSGNFPFSPRRFEKFPTSFGYDLLWCEGFAPRTAENYWAGEIEVFEIGEQD